MADKIFTHQMIDIKDPSKLVLSIDGSFKNAQNQSLEAESLKNLPRKIAQSQTLVIEAIDFKKICDYLNEKYKDGFYYEEETEIIGYPSSRITVDSFNNILDNFSNRLSQSEKGMRIR